MPSFEVEKPIIQTPETLRNLTEQASEIRDILSEINALSTPKEVAKTPIVDSTEDKKLDIPDYEIILIDEEEESISKATEAQKAQQTIAEIIATEPEIIEIIPQPEPEEEIEQQVALPEEEEEIEEELPLVKSTKKAHRKPVKAVENPIDEIETENETVEPVILGPKKKRKGLRFFIGLLIVLLIIGGGIYAAYFSSSCIRCWVQYELFSEANRQKLSEYSDSIKGWFTSDKKTQENDSIKNDSTGKITLPDSATEPEPDQTVEEQPTVPVDSLQQLFNSRREYKEFL
ncbi:hypothetical protein JZU68_02535, partial [bacterium]|nr:hypothetical protein [bacterium]